MSRSDDTDTARSVNGNTDSDKPEIQFVPDLTPLWGRWLTREQVIAGLQIGKDRITQLHSEGLRPRRVGIRNLYDIADIHAWVAAQIEEGQ